MQGEIFELLGALLSLRHSGRSAGGRPSAWQARLGSIHHAPTPPVQATHAALAGALLRDPAWGPAGVGRADGQEPEHSSD